MAVIEEFTTSQGVHIRIRDDAIAGVSKEEMKRRIDQVRRTAWQIAIAEQVREREGDPGDPSPV